MPSEHGCLIPLRYMVLKLNVGFVELLDLLTELSLPSLPRSAVNSNYPLSLKVMIDMMNNYFNVLMSTNYIFTHKYFA